MKKTLFRFWMVAGLLFLHCSLYAQKPLNYPLPQQPDTLRILGVGNSFTDDGMMYLPDLLEAAGVRNVVLGRLYIGGCSLERHCNEYDGNNTSYIYYKSVGNRWITVSEHAALTEGITDEPWDIIELQQVSGLSGFYATYQPWLDRLTEIVRLHSTNAGACIAWQQTWAYAGNSRHENFVYYGNDQQQMYDMIMIASEKVTQDTPIEVVIPSGTAIQNLRNTKLCDSSDLTRDGYHLNFRTGRYTAACAWFQALIAPSLHTALHGNSCRLEGSPNELTEEEAEACRQAAVKACVRRFSLWTEYTFKLEVQF